MDTRAAPTDFAPLSQRERGRGRGPCRWVLRAMRSRRAKLVSGAGRGRADMLARPKTILFSIIIHYQWVDPMHTRVHG